MHMIHSAGRLRFFTLVLATASGLAACASSTASHADAPHAAAAPRGALTLRIGSPLPVHPIPAGFLGLSLEFPAIPAYAGTDPQAIDPVFEQLIRNVAPGQSPVLRIGGDSTDWTWWPVPGMARPAGVNYTLTRNWLAVASALTNALGARLIMGIDLEADS